MSCVTIYECEKKQESTNEKRETEIKADSFLKNTKLSITKNKLLRMSITKNKFL